MKSFSVFDRLFHVALTGAYRLMRMYWWMRRPRTHGALVALWHDGKILLIRNSYHQYFSLPGGYVRPGEPAREAAVRELKEELGMSVSIRALRPALDQELIWEFKREHVEIFSLECGSMPEIEVDGREVVSAEFFCPEEALPLEMYPPIRLHIEEVVRGRSGSE